MRRSLIKEDIKKSKLTTTTCIYIHNYIQNLVHASVDQYLNVLNLVGGIRDFLGLLG